MIRTRPIEVPDFIGTYQDFVEQWAVQFPDEIVECSDERDARLAYAGALRDQQDEDPEIAEAYQGARLVSRLVSVTYGIPDWEETR